MRSSFYGGKNIVQYVSMISKKKFFLKKEVIKKVLSVNDYNKRIFSEDLKTTSPLFYIPPY